MYCGAGPNPAPKNGGETGLTAVCRTASDGAPWLNLAARFAHPRRAEHV